MKTASFFTYAGPGRISIARFAPRGTPAGFRTFRALAPGPWFNSVERDEYVQRYDAEILSRLDPQETFDRLHELAGEAEPVLLCWERPPLTAENWCHRRIVAEWFQDRLGVAVPEFEAQAALDLTR
jgi:hypothetical protein